MCKIQCYILPGMALEPSVVIVVRGKNEGLY